MVSPPPITLSLVSVSWTPTCAEGEMGLDECDVKARWHT